MALKGSRRRATTSRYLIESREAEQKLAEARKKKKARTTKPTNPNSPSELDTSLTFEDTRAIGATLGSGAVMVFDDATDLKQILLRIAEFFRKETCGQCVPCRVGVTRQKEVLERLFAKRPLGSSEQELRLLQEMAQAMRDASICGLGQTASSALLSAVSRWSVFS